MLRRSNVLEGIGSTMAFEDILFPLLLLGNSFSIEGRKLGTSMELDFFWSANLVTFLRFFVEWLGFTSNNELAPFEDTDKSVLLVQSRSLTFSCLTVVIPAVLNAIDAASPVVANGVSGDKGRLFSFFAGQHRNIHVIEKQHSATKITHMIM